MKFALTAVSFLLAVAASAAVEHYYDHSVYRLRPENESEFRMLKKLEDDGVDFWREADQINRIADVMLTPANKEKVLKYFQDNGIKYELLIPDVESRVEEERQQQRRAEETFQTREHFANNNRAEAIAGFWNTYQRYDQHLALVDALAAQNPSIVSRVNIGTSYQGRSLVAARIGSNQGPSKRVIWIEGGIHAREWISPATVTFFAQDLVDKFNAGDAGVVDLLSYFDFYIVPVLNADGYEYTHTNSRLWRKTRRPSDVSPSCIGTDPNRNFGYQWGGEGASTNACAETYRGDKAFSEPEVKAETDYILANFNNGQIKSFLSVHSYGQYFLYPWGYTSALTPDDSELNRVAKAAVAALNTVSASIRYTIGTSTNVLYAAAGGADDWSYGSAKAKFSYTVELRDTGTYGFQLPASQIKITGQETSAAFIALAKEVKAASLRDEQ